jgi:hypothetical protein
LIVLKDALTKKEILRAKEIFVTDVAGLISFLRNQGYSVRPLTVQELALYYSTDVKEARKLRRLLGNIYVAIKKGRERAILIGKPKPIGGKRKR